MAQVVLSVNYPALGQSQPVVGKITATRQKDGTFTFRWTISHSYRLENDANIYHSTVTSRKSLEQCRALMDQYAKGFQIAVEIVENPRWK